MRPNDHMRVQKEIKNILKDTASGVMVELKAEASIKVGRPRSPSSQPRPPSHPRLPLVSLSPPSSRPFLQYMIGSLVGPKDTPYEGGLFYVDIELDDQYPFAPPKMKFST